MDNDVVMNTFIENSYELLHDYDKSGRYYHTLTPKDNSPIVVHKKTNQLTTVIKGMGKVILNGKVYVASEGVSIFIEAGTTHQFKAETSEMILFHIHIPDEGRELDRYIVEGEDYNRIEY